MPLPKRWNKSKPPPAGFEAIEATLEALEHELRDRIKETNERKRKTESMWPVHQIGWQKSRYVYDMFYTYKRISRPVYEYCLRQKLVDAALIAKWKKPGYERLCSTYVINPTNYKFGTTSICRVPMKDRGPEQKTAVDPTTGCLGCASGPGAGPKNIFGNKYGQYLAAVQVAREARIEGAKEQRRKEEEEQERTGNDETDDDSDTDSGGDDDGVWAGSGRVGTRDESDSETEEPIIPPSAKRART
ncbi:unnamed protein product [Pseudo-nitzschia multistriata]|uniref:G10 protein n=1 Tax=Pseudo-nitzschia multistriata TaxID=183589 RepID=A0A448YU76_9STRA|nr:unnamed protein product [Pseudo-nitzschia multistriata]